MGVRAIGVIYLMFSLFILMRPGQIRAWWKNNRDNKPLLFALPVFLGMIFIFAGMNGEGLSSKILLVFGVLGVFKGLVFLVPGLFDALMDRAIKMPDTMLRVAGVFHACVACILILL